MQKTSFKDLKVWQKSIELASDVYTVVRTLPKSEQFGLTSQLGRAVVSIPSNIAEGSKRGGKKEFLQFLRIANGSAAEVETQLILISKLYPEIKHLKASGALAEVQMMLAGLIRSLSENNE
jgi:four helix bundle protein